MNGPIGFFVAVLALANPVAADEFHVATSGNDAWSGKLSEPNAARTDGPFATVTRARDAARRLIMKRLSRGVRVSIHGGLYYVPAGLALRPVDSGTVEHAIVYASAPGEVASLVGGVPIKGWTKYRGRIWRADLPAGIAPTQAFEDGVRMELARTPNRGYLKIESVPPGNESRAFDYRVGDLDPTNWQLEGARVFVWPGHDWFSHETPLAAIDRVTRRITLGSGDGQAMHAGNRYFVRNVLAELDSPGECQIDLRNRHIYCWPRRLPIESRTIVVSSAPHLIAVEGYGAGDTPCGTFISRTSI